MNIAVISIAGIGNTLLATPAIKLLRDSLPESKITLIVSKSACCEILKNSPYIDEIVVFDNKDITRKFFSSLALLLTLRKRKFDASLTVYPSNRIEYNLFAFLIHAKRRITHSYPVGRFRTLAFLQNVKVPSVYARHDVEQNLALLEPLGIAISKIQGNLLISIADDDMKYAQDFLISHNITENEIIIGMHPGSGEQNAKRWEEDKFAELGDALFKRYVARVLVFGAKDEQPIKKEIFSLMKNKPILVDGTLSQTAAIIAHCKLFISNDSGLMHVATAMEVPTIGIFGPTDLTRTRPWGNKHIAFRMEMDCSPCLKYPHFSTNSHIKCQEVKCLKKVTADKVLEVADRLLS